MHPDSMTLEQHAAAWWKKRGEDYYAQDDARKAELYAQWCAWAFRDFADLPTD